VIHSPQLGYWSTKPVSDLGTGFTIQPLEIKGFQLIAEWRIRVLGKMLPNRSLP
jgi:hypothetical protein